MPLKLGVLMTSLLATAAVAESAHLARRLAPPARSPAPPLVLPASRPALPFLVPPLEGRTNRVEAGGGSTLGAGRLPGARSRDALAGPLGLR